MKYFSLLPLAALASAVVIPNEQVLNDVSIEANHRASHIVDSTWSKDEILEGFKKHFNEITETVEDASKSVKTEYKSALDEAFAYAQDVESSVTETAFDAQSWVENFAEDTFDIFEDHESPPKDGPPHKKPGHEKPPHHGKPPHEKPGHPPHHGPPNQTVYQLISESKYTTKFAELINDYPDLVEALNGTKANYTVFAPTDKAFEKIPEHAPKPTKEQIEKILEYHISPEFFPAGRVLVTHTIPTLLKGEHLSDEPVPQRLAVKIGLKGLTLNFYSRVIAIDIFGTNGVIHGVDSLIIPPPNVIKIIDLLPSEFSTLELGLAKTGLLDEFNTTNHPGGTLFAPSNFAFAKLGPKINAFLFSDFGKKYLKALLEYHVVPGTTLYSDAKYDNHLGEDMTMAVSHKGKCTGEKKIHSKGDKESHKDGEKHHQKGDKKMKSRDGKHKVPKGYYHYTLATLLKDQNLEVDIARYGGFITIKVNGFGRVVVQDGIAQDGVIQVVGDVLIPPKNKLPGKSSKKSWFQKAKDAVQGEKEMTVEEFKARFESFVSEDVEAVEEEFKLEM